MDSIDVYTLLDVVWTILIGHMLIGFVWARVPVLSQLYVKTAAAYAAAAMENYSVALVAEKHLGDAHLKDCADLALAGIQRADASADYYRNQRKFFINMLWVTELRWALECLRGIERLGKSTDEMKKRAAERKSGAQWRKKGGSMQNQYQFAQAAVWLSAWMIAYFAIGLVLAWKVIPKWHLSAMRKYVEIQYDYYMRICKEPGVPETLAAQYRKEMRACAANGEKLKKDLPNVPFSHWWLLWPMEIFVCLRMESMSAKVRKRIRSWDAKRTPWNRKESVSFLFLTFRKP